MNLIKDDKAFVLKNYFDPEKQLKIYNACKLIENSTLTKIEQRNGRPNRKYKVNDLNLARVHYSLKSVVENLYSEKLKLSYNFYSSYFPKAELPEHLDRPICYITASYCVDQSAIWPFYIEEKRFDLDVNDLIIFKGNELKHHRKMNTGNNTCGMILFHFVKVDYEGSLEPDSTNVIYSD